MEQYHAIPAGYMTVGEIANKMNTTVRTLQYYDKIGLLSPTAESEGGRRLYSDSDIVKLHQIQSMKYLGLSLNDIKDWMIHLETPEDVARALTKQAQDIRDEIKRLSENLIAVEKLKEETLQMQTVDWKKYAYMLVLMQQKNEFYGAIKFYNGKMLDFFYNRSIGAGEHAAEFAETQNRLCGKIIQLQKKGVSPESAPGQAIAKDWWKAVMKLTGGDIDMAKQFYTTAAAQNYDGTDSRSKKLAALCDFFVRSLEKYFADNNIEIDSDLKITH